MNTNLISIKSVLQDLSTVLPEELWNSEYLLQWAYKGAKKIAVEPQLANYICFTEVRDHEATLPQGWKYINMVVGKWDISYEDLKEDLARTMNLENSLDNPALDHMAYPEALVERALTREFITSWSPIRRSSSPFMKTVHCDSNFYICPECQYEYVIEPDKERIVTTLKEGVFLISYQSFPKNKENDLLIPDHEDFKEAVMHYCLYRYYLSRVIRKDQAAYREREWHLSRYQALLLKAKSLGLPDIDTIENITQRQSRLIKWADRYNGLFTDLSSQEKIKY